MRITEANANVDVSDLLPRVSVPTLVMHARDEARVPFDAGRRVADRHDRQLRRSVHDLEVLGHLRVPVEQGGLLQVPTDRLAELRGAVGSEREPRLQGPERT